MLQQTFKQAYDKVIDAYFKDKLEPNKPQFCFCGNICGNSTNWYISQTEGTHRTFLGYYGNDFVRMEKALFSNFRDRFSYDRLNDYPEYEDELFAGMCAAIDVLKQVHIEHGEVIDEVPVFEKRVLNTTL